MIYVFFMQMSLSGVQRMLGYGDQAGGFRFLCESHGIRCDAVNDRLILNRRTFFTPESRIVSRENYMIESKLKTSVRLAYIYKLKNCYPQYTIEGFKSDLPPH